MKFEWMALRAGRYGGIDVVGFRVAEASSVLAGQMLTCFVDNFPDEETARAEYPYAQRFTSEWTGPRVSVSHLPGPEDQCPGGAWPDDLS